MDFEAVWNRLTAGNRWELTTTSGDPLVAFVTERSIRFESPNDQPRSVSKDRFRKWFHLWFNEGRRKNSDLRNETGQESRAGNIRHVKQLFALIGGWSAEIDPRIAEPESAECASDPMDTALGCWNHARVYEALVNRGERQNFRADPTEPYVTLYPQDPNCAVLYAPTTKRYSSGPLHLNQTRPSWQPDVYAQIRPAVREVRTDNQDFTWYRVLDWKHLAAALGLIDLTGPTIDPIEFDRRVCLLRKQPSLPRPTGQQVPSKRAVTSQSTYERRPDVKAWVLIESRGICELCQQPAPFVGTDGEPYLELHHVQQLAEGGSDTVENAAAVCPSCHRWLHYGRDREEQQERLYRQVARLIRADTGWATREETS